MAPTPVRRTGSSCARVGADNNPPTFADKYAAGVGIEIARPERRDADALQSL